MTDTVRIHDLALDADMFGTSITIHPVLLWDATDGATLVDAGVPGLFPLLRQAVERAGVPFRQLRRVILTHQDWDHTGALPDILAAGEGITVCAHRLEKPYIEGALPNYKLTPEKIAARIAALPPEAQPKAAAVFAALPVSPVHRALVDGELLPFHGGLEVIHTPGHTPGNLCLYLKNRRLLIAGDQLRVVDGALVGPAPEHTPDMPTALTSLKKLAAYDIDRVLCYHGGPYGPNAAPSIATLVGCR
ncbi:MBL fold metallo-hydrolase [Anaeroselena agilis]|uniref:MBL fold metallo-hydrolase n=1 Tax=Anaeroselena agilis TaxID=3063788 RepID=A0ABU3P0Z4_9FIRM|nr:MBL fold metallo-hydrolase [Selenomonadales bacterium 4137-cl]